MKRLSVSEMTTYRWSFDEDIYGYSAAGIGSLAVWRQKLADFGEEKGIELLAETGMRVSSLLWAGGFTGSEGRSHQESIDDGADAIRLAHALGAGCLVVYTGARGGHTHNHARRLVKSALTKLLPLARELNVTLAIEPMHAGCAGEWTFLTCLDDTLELMDSLDSPDLKIVFDMYHLGGESQILDRISQIVNRVAIVQFGDAKSPPNGEQNRCRLGDGALPVKDMVRAFEAAGYEGLYEIELMGEDIEPVDYDDLIAEAKQLCAAWIE